jgi:hypothetical protein
MLSALNPASSLTAQNHEQSTIAVIVAEMPKRRETSAQTRILACSLALHY